jgi:urea transport system permease protein
MMCELGSLPRRRHDHEQHQGGSVLSQHAACSPDKASLSDNREARDEMGAITGLCLLIGGLLVGIAPDSASAQTPRLAGALQRFAADSYGETISAIEEIAGSGAPTARAILDALADGRLYYAPNEKSVFFKDASDKLYKAEDGQPAGLPAEALSPVRLNNRVRGVLQAALGAMALLAPDPAKRLLAADSVLKAKDIKSLPLVEAALAQEKDPRVNQAFKEARAAIVLVKPDAKPADQITAIATLSRRIDQDAIAALRAAAASSRDAQVKEAATIAIASAERRLQLLAAAQNVWYGLSLGSVLLLAAIGLAITFGVMGVINMAHGEMVMLGAYTTFVVQEGFRAISPSRFDWSLPLAIPLAFLVAALVGVAIERGIIRFLYGRPLETLLSTWGVSLILQQAVRTIFGPTNREVGAPNYMSGSFEVMGLSITWGRLCIIIFTLVTFLALLVLLKATPLGLQMRAVTQNRRMAGSMGIPTGRIDALTFALGSGIAGIAGVALSQIDNVSPNLGQGYIIDSFMVVVFGGVGNLWGTFVSAFALGVANKLLEPFAGAVLGKILILVLLILFIQKRPRGLFALRGRAVEA